MVSYGTALQNKGSSEKANRPSNGLKERIKLLGDKTIPELGDEVGEKVRGKLEQSVIYASRAKMLRKVAKNKTKVWLAMESLFGPEFRNYLQTDSSIIP